MHLIALHFPSFWKTPDGMPNEIMVARVPTKGEYLRIEDTVWRVSAETEHVGFHPDSLSSGWPVAIVTVEMKSSD